MKKKRPPTRVEGEKNCPNMATKATKRDSEDVFKCVGIASLIGVLAMAVALGLLALLLTVGNLPLGAIRPAGVVVGCVGAMTAGFVCSRIRKQKGFFLGLICAGVLFLILMLLSVTISGQAPGSFALIKLFSMLICGAVGGSLGVNMKRKG